MTRLPAATQNNQRERAVAAREQLELERQTKAARAAAVIRSQVQEEAAQRAKADEERQLARDRIEEEAARYAAELMQRAGIMPVASSPAEPSEATEQTGY